MQFRRDPQGTRWRIRASHTHDILGIFVSDLDVYVRYDRPLRVKVPVIAVVLVRKSCSAVVVSKMPG